MSRATAVILRRANSQAITHHACMAYGCKLLTASVTYPYASGLVVYNRPLNLVVPIESAADMHNYLARYSPGRGDTCPLGWSGNGVTILPRPLS